MEREIEFFLDNEIKYASNGESEEAKVLILKAPTNKQRYQRAYLKSLFSEAIKNSAEGEDKPQAQKKEEDIQDELDWNAIMMTFYMGGTDMKKLISEFELLITSPGVCLIEGKHAFLKKHFEELDAEDSERLMGTYLQNFILASFLSKV